MNHDAYEDAELTGVLQDVRTIALLGASPNASRPSYGVMSFLLSKGYRVIPVNPGHGGQQILGQQVAASLGEIADPVDLVDVFRNSDAVPGVVDEVLAVKDRLAIKALWLQIGVRDDAAAAKAEAAGLKVVMDHCLKVEIRRLGL